MQRLDFQIFGLRKLNQNISISKWYFSCFSDFFRFFFFFSEFSEIFRFLIIFQNFSDLFQIFQNLSDFFRNFQIPQIFEIFLVLKRFFHNFPDFRIVSFVRFSEFSDFSNFPTIHRIISKTMICTFFDIFSFCIFSNIYEYFRIFYTNMSWEPGRVGSKQRWWCSPYLCSCSILNPKP